MYMTGSKKYRPVDKTQPRVGLDLWSEKNPSTPFLLKVEWDFSLINIYIYIHTHTHTHTYLYVCTHTHTYIHTYIHTHIHTYIRTHIHTHTTHTHIVCVCVCILETRIKVVRPDRMFLLYLQKKFESRVTVEWLTTCAFLRTTNTF
jgi:hypothetical protein